MSKSGELSAMAEGYTQSVNKLLLRIEDLEQRLALARSALERIAQIRCGIYGHSVAVGCGASRVADLALQESYALNAPAEVKE